MTRITPGRRPTGAVVLLVHAALMPILVADAFVAACRALRAKR